jgi:hypothetical protein
MNPGLLFKSVMGGMILIHALTLFFMPLLPFIDLPNHLAEATIFKYQYKDEILGTHYKAVPAFYPNTFHTVFCSLFPNVELGNKIFYILYILLLYISVYLLIKQLKGNVWIGLLCTLLIYNYNTTWGFTGFTIAIPTLLLLYHSALKEKENRKLSQTAWSAILLLLLYSMHAQVALLGMMLYAGLLIFSYRDQKTKLIMKTLLVMVPVMVIMFFWWSHRTAGIPEGSTFKFLWKYYSHEFFPDLYRRTLVLVYDQLALAHNNKLAASFISFLILLPLIIYVTRSREQLNLRSRQMQYALLLFLASSICFFLLPNSLPGQTPLHERFSSFVILSFIILMAVILQQVRSKQLVLYSISISLFYSVLWFEYLYAFNRENHDFSAELFKGVDSDKILAGLMYDHRFRNSDVYIHFPNYNVVWNKGLTASKIIDYRFGVVRRGNKGNLIPRYHEWVGWKYQETDYRDSVDYLLQRGYYEAPDTNTEGFSPHKKASQWAVLKNNRKE